MRTGHYLRPETLLAGIDTDFTELVIPALAGLAQKELPSTGASFAGQTCPGLFTTRIPALSPPAAPGWRAFSQVWSCAPWPGPSPVTPYGNRC